MVRKREVHLVESVLIEALEVYHMLNEECSNCRGHLWLVCFRSFYGDIRKQRDMVWLRFCFKCKRGRNGLKPDEAIRVRQEKHSCEYKVRSIKPEGEFHLVEFESCVCGGAIADTKALMGSPTFGQTVVPAKKCLSCGETRMIVRSQVGW